MKIVDLTVADLLEMRQNCSCFTELQITLKDKHCNDNAVFVWKKKESDDFEYLGNPSYLNKFQECLEKIKGKKL